MSKMTDEFRLEQPQPSAQSTCVRAIEALGWKLSETAADRLVIKTGWGLFKNPGTIEVLLVDAGGTATAIQLNGSIAQVGPVARRKLRQHIEELRGAVEAAAAQSG
jgi:hypothetical protein